MKRLKIVCILMAILLLAGCTASPGATETLSREEQETGQIALMGQPVESEPSPQPSKESSQEHFEDTVSVEETPYQWDFQKGWKVFGGYFDLPEHIVSTGIFGLLGLPYTEWIGKANNDAKQQGEEVLFHVFFRTETDVTAFGVAFDDVEQGEYTGYHADLSLADMTQLSTLADIHFDFCTCGREYDESRIAKLWWNTPDVDWDFRKNWPLYVLSEEDWETLIHGDELAIETPIGSPTFWRVVDDFYEEELLFEVCMGTYPPNGDCELFFRSLGIPYKILEDDLYPQQIYLLNLSVSDCIHVVQLMHQAGLVWAEDASIFGIYRHGEPLLDVETMFDVPKNEFHMPEMPSYNWDFQKDLPLFVFRPEDEELYWDFPEVCFPYGDARWYCLTTAFDMLGEEMLYHVTIKEHVVESGYQMVTVDPETPVDEFLSYFEIPFESVGDEFYYHLNLSYRDAVTLVGLLHKAGLVESEKAGVFDFCYCGDLCGATHTVSPALPEWYEVLRK